jgi:hypothetical protein
MGVDDGAWLFLFFSHFNPLGFSFVLLKKVWLKRAAPGILSELCAYCEGPGRRVDEWI